MKIIGIYIVFNRISKKVYIGSSIDVVSRLRKHKNQLKLGKHPNRHLQLSFNKHGLESFKFTVIFQCEKDTTDNKLRQLEQEFINKVKPNRLYNICPVAGSTLGRRHSEETKQKIKQSIKGKEYKIRQKPVMQIDVLTGEVINEFKTAGVAGAILKINPASIWEVCKGSTSRKIAGGFIWKYKNYQGIV